jgi:hypothetical protein
MLARDPSAGRPGGYTLVELMVVNVLMGLLMLLLAGAWRACGPLCVEVIARSRIAGEANVAAAALYADTHTSSRTLVSNGITVLGSNSIQIGYGTSSSGPVTWTVTYTFIQGTDPSQQDGRLVRTDPNGTFTIARHVEAMTATAQGSGAELAFSFYYRSSRSQYTFEVHP